MSTKAEIAWAAGLFEGEGCFTNRNTQRPSPIAQLSMTDEDVVLRFATVMGVGSVRATKRIAGRKQQWRWTTSHSSEFLVVFEMMRPWLGPRRTSRAVQLIADRLEWEGRKELRQGATSPHSNRSKLRSMSGRSAVLSAPLPPTSRGFR